MNDNGAHVARENYLKIIVKHLTETGAERMASGEIARLLGVSSGTASVMIQKLEKAGYLSYESHRGCGLTPQGRAAGLEILRRHRLIELFLVRSLGLDWSEVHDEAERLEHAWSDKLTDRIDAWLGFPARDPHGDPIPAKGQTMLQQKERPFRELQEGEAGLVVRVEGGAEILDYYREEGLIPGAELKVLQQAGASGLVEVEVSGRQRRLALSALDGLFFEPADLT